MSRRFCAAAPQLRRPRVPPILLLTLGIDGILWDPRGLPFSSILYRYSRVLDIRDGGIAASGA